MRLICPNCSAQYEVDASIIPAEGRDVQCSNCGHTWFEVPAIQAETDDSARVRTRREDVVPVPPPVQDDADEIAEDVADKDTEEYVTDDDEAFSSAARAIAAATEAADDKDIDAEAEDVFGPPAEPVRRGATAESMQFLREEADREIAKRRAPPSEAFETQTDMALDELESRRTPSRALHARMATRGETAPVAEPKPPSFDNPPANTDGTDYQPTQRDLLPDIDEINSTLRPDEDAARAAAARRRNGFRFGFFLTVLIAVGLILAYAFAPTLARFFPDIEPTLISYVDAANRARDWIDSLLNSSL